MRAGVWGEVDGEEGEVRIMGRLGRRRRSVGSRCWVEGPMKENGLEGPVEVESRGETVRVDELLH